MKIYKVDGKYYKHKSTAEHVLNEIYLCLKKIEEDCKEVRNVYSPVWDIKLKKGKLSYKSEVPPNHSMKHYSHLIRIETIEVEDSQGGYKDEPFYQS